MQRVINVFVIARSSLSNISFSKKFRTETTNFQYVTIPFLTQLRKNVDFEFEGLTVAFSLKKNANCNLIGSFVT